MHDHITAWDSTHSIEDVRSAAAPAATTSDPPPEIDPGGSTCVPSDRSLSASWPWPISLSDLRPSGRWIVSDGSSDTFGHPDELGVNWALVRIRERGGLLDRRGRRCLQSRQLMDGHLVAPWRRRVRRLVRLP